MSTLVPLSTAQQILMPADANADVRYRLNKYAQWLDRIQRPWYLPNLSAYRDYLLEQEGLKSTSVAALIHTVRSRYRHLLRESAFRELAYQMANQALSNADFGSLKAYVDELQQIIENAIHPDAVPVQVVKRQDRNDKSIRRLTREQADELINAPIRRYGQYSLVGLRDAALISLMLCTGIREGEAAALQIEDLRQRLNGEFALHIREGKGCKERLVVYGTLSWCVTIVEQWLTAANIEAGDVFRGFYKGHQNVRSTPLTTRMIQIILDQYPVTIEGEQISVNPHDLRRTYAKLSYEAGMDIVAIGKNLGHSDTKTTLHYIGDLSAFVRRTPAIYSKPSWL